MMAQQSFVEDVAIVGLSCRTAGGNDTPEQLWKFLLDQKQASGEVPSQRWEPWLQRDPRNVKILKNIIRKGYFLDNLEHFDAAFFGISPKEAELMDPHHRLALELTVEALEHAGIDLKRLAKSDTAVYMGVDSDDYSRMLMEDLPSIEAWTGIGTAAHGIPNRISYHLDLQGPSTAVDAACASSLIAIHLARQAIVSGESNVAICGGVNVICAPGLSHMLQKAGALSTEGVCRSFDEAACGYARGEGGAVVVLKRLSSAMADNDNILAVLKGTASAQDGKTNGIMAPNAKAQEMVGRQALLRSGDIDPLTIGYVEAHATSTSLGDPTEIDAIAKVYGTGRARDLPCFIGSIKPNVGHLEAAAGAIGFVKTVMTVQKGELAPQALLENLNSKIEWETSGLEVVREAGSWPQGNGPRRAAVCCYGYGGSVCHAIIEQTPVYHTSEEKCDQLNTATEVLIPLVLSAHQEKRLVGHASTLASWLSAEGRSEDLTAIARTLSQRRAAHDYRAVFVVANHEEAIRALTNFAQGKQDRCTVNNRIIGNTNRRGVVWVFSGHGAQWPNMGKELLHNVIFQAGFSVLEALERGDLGGSDRIQILTSKGVSPQAVIGHSVGEIAAAVTAGCLTMEEGAVVVQGQGAMALVNLPFAQVAQELEKKTDVVAAIKSSPFSCDYVEDAGRRGVKTWKIQTDIAFHSPMREMNPRPAEIPIYSTSHLDARTMAPRNTGYWIQNMVAPVLLEDAIDAALEDGYRIFLETLAARSIEESAAFGLMRRDIPTELEILHAVSYLYTLGAQVDFRIQLGASPWSVLVPNTPWVHKPYWKTISTVPLTDTRQHDIDMHTLLGGVKDVAGSDMKIWTTTLNDTSKPYPLTHPLDGTEIIPAAVYCNTFHRATEASIIDNLKLRIPLPMTADEREVQVVTKCNKIYMYSRLSNPKRILDSDDFEHTWVEHSTAEFSTVDMAPYQIQHSISNIKARLHTQLSNNFAWDYLQKIGVSGIAFPWAVLEHFGDEKEMLVKMDMDPVSQTMSWNKVSWAPFLDAATSVGSSIFFKSVRLRIVSGIDRVLFLSDMTPPKIGWLFIEEMSEDQNLRVDISVLDEEGRLLAKLEGMRFSDVEAVDEKSKGVDTLVHQIAWVPPKFAETPLSLTHVVLVATDSQIADKHASSLQLQTRDTISVRSSVDLYKPHVMRILAEKDTYVFYIPGVVEEMEQVAAATHAFTWETASLLKILSTIPNSPRLFVITDMAYSGRTPTTLAHYPLHGFARIAASEHPELWGGLIDNEGTVLPLLAIKYVRDQDVIRMQDGLPRVARMRPFVKDQLQHDSSKALLPRPHGTYLVTGGFGDLGLEVLDFLVQKGARRVVVVSRRPLPPRKDWHSATGQAAVIIEKIQKLESLGASIHAIALDIGSPSASTTMLSRLDQLSLPPVLGIVHAAGVAGYDYIKEVTSDSLACVLAPKVQGALALHNAFPPKSLDFFVLFSSIGQIVGSAGQSSYGTANAFLDGLAIHRRGLGDNAIAIQWTAWRNMGLAAEFWDYLILELENKGVTDITIEEGFQAWEHLSMYDTDHAVVTRTRILDANEPSPCPLIDDIVQRRAPVLTPSTSSSSLLSIGSTSIPKSGPELKADLSLKIRECLCAVLHLDIEDIDDRAAIADLGVDSVMTVSLRQQLQKVMGIKVPPTLTWSHPTVIHLIDWFYAQIESGK
ncbi:ketoacyl-synt-domain-containing protein [Dothidotthia symphoricarpi CBS 119687]|uniref:6-methylsalicylic acid synthase n=1 Tax=Dothidotthia symphoricarpi CBS 119687 TaxID=1392245 RepID=A0A6A6AA05_9PLEO|nr:ketoacyl-synt-domain-containing protein [Dothidotthia symphoricarpi CBS 119687]KAF2128650.1 ketoacyl-synt-domain-containing protein [Dothidotthia symphoricarpi CBS 119687]